MGNTATSTATVTVSILPGPVIDLGDYGGELLMTKGLDTITFNLVNNTGQPATVRFTDPSQGEVAPFVINTARSSGPGNLSITSRTDSQLVITDDSRNQGHADSFYTYAVNVYFSIGGFSQILTFDPIIDDEGDTGPVPESDN